MGKLSTSNKWVLLGALYKNGSEIENLQEDLQDWSEDQIKNAIKSYRGRADRNLQAAQNKNKDPIDSWYDLIQNCHQIEGTDIGNASRNEPTEDGWENYSFLLSKSLMYAASFEEHYQGKTPNDPNYNEIYRYLAKLLAGEEPTQLKPANAKKVLKMMEKMKELLDNKESVQRYLNYISTKHSVSYLQPDVDVMSIVQKKKEEKPEAQPSEVMQLFQEPDSSNEASACALDEKDPQYETKKEKIALKSSLKQRALASTLLSVPGMNPLEMVLPSFVKPSNSLLQLTRPSKKRKIQSEQE